MATLHGRRPEEIDMSTFFDRFLIMEHGNFNTTDQPHPDARRVWGLMDDPKTGSRQAGWLMPQVSDVHPKTARHEAKLRALGVRS